MQVGKHGLVRVVRGERENDFFLVQEEDGVQEGHGEGAAGALHGE